MSDQLYVVGRVLNHDRAYLRIERDGNFKWLDASDYDSWDDCKAYSTKLSFNEAAFVLNLARLMHPVSEFEFVMEHA